MQGTVNIKFTDKKLFPMFIQEYIVYKECISVIMIYGVLIGVNVHKRTIYIYTYIDYDLFFPTLQRKC